MKLENALENYYTLSGKASEVARALTLAGIAVVWVFKNDIAGRPVIPSALVNVSIGLIVALALDLLHYVLGSALWGVFHRQKEKEHGVTGDTEFVAPHWINWPALGLFWGKVVTVLVAYVLLLAFLAGHVATV